jgi:TAG lipase/lysophosphatidylethanolamine acyltransferase
LELSSVKTPIDALEDKLDAASDFAQWSKTALELDLLRGYEHWKYVPNSEYYDYKQLKKRTMDLLSLLKTRDFAIMTYTLRSGLLRNYCGVADTRLFSKYYLGTKFSIDDYNKAYAELLRYISLTDFTNATSKFFVID